MKNKNLYAYLQDGDSSVFGSLPENQKQYILDLQNYSGKYQPPPYKPTDMEHRLAYTEKILSDIEESLENVKESVAIGDFSGASDSIKYLIKAFSNGSNDFSWENMEIDNVAKASNINGFERFKIKWTSYLEEEHAGDCRKMACSCMRCWAEDLYGIPNSLLYRGSKSHGG